MPSHRHCHFPSPRPKHSEPPHPRTRITIHAHPPTVLLRIEEAVLFILTLFAYQHLHYSSLLFAILFLTPDLFMLGYLINPRAGAASYNLAHTLTLPFALLPISYIEHWPLVTAIALIWTAHIAFDRLLGYGLKYPTFFKDTHLQHI